MQPRRLQMLVEAGRLEEAIAEAAARPSDEYGRDAMLAQLLEQDGRVDEAVDVLRRSTQLGQLGAHRELAELLIRQGRPADAIVVMSAQREQAMQRLNNDESSYGDDL